jgi:hypothetical protein
MDVKLLINVLLGPNEPEISSEIWAELETKVLATVASFADTLVLKLELAAVNEPEIPAAVKFWGKFVKTEPLTIN